METTELPFVLKYSLMDRFINIFLKKEKGTGSLKFQILNGLKPFKSQGNGYQLYINRKEWFERSAEFVNWRVLETSDIDNEILNAVYLVFSVLGEEAENKKYEAVKGIFDDLVRLAVVDKSNHFITYSQYKTGICSSDLALQYILYKLGFVVNVETNIGKTTKTAIQLKGEAEKRNQSGSLTDITFDNISEFIKRRIDSLDVKSDSRNATHYTNVKNLINRLKQERNNESHNAFLTDPGKYWSRLTYMLYDYVTIVFFLMRYFRGVVSGTVPAVMSEDIETVKKAVEYADMLIGKAKRIRVRFQYDRHESEVQKLSISKDGVLNNIKHPDYFTTSEGKEKCYYEEMLDRSTTYFLQSFVEENGKDVAYGKKLELNTSLLFNGAVVDLKMPTKVIPYPTIDSVIEDAAGFVENEEQRAVINNVIANNIEDEDFRNKLRLLLLNSGGNSSVLSDLNTKDSIASESEIKQIINEKHSEQDQKLNSVYKKLSEEISKSNEVERARMDEALAEMKLTDALTRDIKSNIQELHNIVDDLREDVNGLSENVKILQGKAGKTESTVSNLGKDVSKIKDRVEKARQSRKKTNSAIAVIADLIFIVFFVVINLHFAENIPFGLNAAADALGNLDAAYNHANELENKGNYSDAANWYLKSRGIYSGYLIAHPNDSVRASRMAEMTMRGKGGFINTDTAQYYAHLAKRYDLEAYLAFVNGKHYEARTLINNCPTKNSRYLQLADAVDALLYPPKDFEADKLESYWTIIDSLAWTKNPAQQEAIETAIKICDNGIVDDQAKFLVAPALYDAVRNAQYAAENFNSLYAQLYLASKFDALYQKEKAEYYNRMSESNNRLGNGEIAFSDKRILELTNDPQALVAMAQKNAEAGYTDYNMTAYYYHLADSINNKNQIYHQGDRVLSDWTNFVVNAKNLSSVEQITPIVNRQYPDSIRLAIANYIMAMKYSNGTGVECDSIKSGNHLLKAAELGLADAQVAVATIWDRDSIADGMKILRRLTSGPRDSIHPWAARYILSKAIKDNVLEGDLIAKADFRDEYPLLIKLNEVANIDLYKFDESTLHNLKNHINIALAQKTDYSDCAYLIGKLGEIEYALNRPDAADFYMDIANNISPKESYTSLWGLSESARRRQDLETAHWYAGGFAKVFFRDSGDVLYESQRRNVVQHFQDLYPEILELVKKNTGHDFTQGIFVFKNESFDRDKRYFDYKSPVTDLRIDLPDYERPAFPITMKYFQ